MTPVLTLVSAVIAADRRDEVTRGYRQAIAAGLPDGIRETFLLVHDDGTLAIATVWEDEGKLEAMRSSGEEPLARRLLREAGGDPELRVFGVAAMSSRESL